MPPGRPEFIALIGSQGLESKPKHNQDVASPSEPGDATIQRVAPEQERWLRRRRGSPTHAENTAFAGAAVQLAATRLVTLKQISTLNSAKRMR